MDSTLCTCVVISQGHRDQRPGCPVHSPVPNWQARAMRAEALLWQIEQILKASPPDGIPWDARTQ